MSTLVLVFAVGGFGAFSDDDYALLDGVWEVVTPGSKGWPKPPTITFRGRRATFHSDAPLSIPMDGASFNVEIDGSTSPKRFTLSYEDPEAPGEQLPFMFGIFHRRNDSLYMRFRVMSRKPPEGEGVEAIAPFRYPGDSPPTDFSDGTIGLVLRRITDDSTALAGGHAAPPQCIRSIRCFRAKAFVSSRFCRKAGASRARRCRSR